MSPDDKPLVWWLGEVQTPPFSREARLEAGFLLRQLQKGESLSLPSCSPMPKIGARVHELTINDRNSTWRIAYRIDRDAILVVEVFNKKSRQTPKQVLANCERRLRANGRLVGG